MNTFEYKTVLIPREENPILILNEEGANGWEVIYIESDDDRRIWLKRKKDKVLIHISELNR